MANHQINAQLNRLLIDVARSLLQYVGESWPRATSDQQRTLGRIVERQQQHIAALAELLEHRRWVIDVGRYPTEFTTLNLHYVSLDFLLSRLVESERQLIARIEATLRDCRDDPEAAELVEQLLAEERENLQTLETLAANVTSNNPV